jgi:nitrate reductase alpha subunit
MTEARYRGQKVVVMSPDYSDATKFADDWLAPHPGTDGALAMAMGHVVLKEFFVERETPRFVDYCKRYTDLPFLVTLDRRGDAFVPDKFLTAEDLGDATDGAAFKTVLIDDVTGEPTVPNGTLGDRFTESGKGRWNLDLGDIDPRLTLYGGEGPASIAASASERGAQPDREPTVPASWDRVVVRPSGTEPKLKAYLQVVEPVGTDLRTARATAARRMSALRAEVEELLAPGQ